MSRIASTLAEAIEFVFVSAIWYSLLFVFLLGLVVFIFVSKTVIGDVALLTGLPVIVWISTMGYSKAFVAITGRRFLIPHSEDDDDWTTNVNRDEKHTSRVLREKLTIEQQSDLRKQLLFRIAYITIIGLMAGPWFLSLKKVIDWWEKAV
jgi:hypothetical protein